MARPRRAPVEALRALADESPLPVRVRGGSMGSALPDGSAVRVGARRPWPGDVVVVRSRDGSLVAHRLLGAYRRGGEVRLVTRGDAVKRADAPVRASQLVGVADVSVPVGARALAAARFAAWAVRAVARRWA